MHSAHPSNEGAFASLHGNSHTEPYVESYTDAYTHADANPIRKTGGLSYSLFSLLTKPGG
eukprot:3902875-Alexandrium_andersonii.AAC.1